jgi:tetraacyldisaccharide 4'-kinase
LNNSTLHLQQIWQRTGWLNILLLPLAALFTVIVNIRRWLYQKAWLRTYISPVPVIVIGNITVGGSGKTPLVIWLAQHLRNSGYMPGIVSRGYRGQNRHWPLQVTAETDPQLAGDEPVLLAKHTGCPIYAGPDRPAAIAALLKNTSCAVIISDDGMQHYAMARDIEIAVLDADYGLGNGWMLPAGPLRESPTRLRTVDLQIVNGDAADGYAMRLAQPRIAPLYDNKPPTDLQTWRGQAVQAIAGIGHPSRFFNLLTRHHVKVEAYPMPDHHAYQITDFTFRDNRPLLMTEKDAVKCRQLNLTNAWVVSVQAEPDKGFIQDFDRRLKNILNQEHVHHGQKIT